jgi:hypothetical protein
MPDRPDLVALQLAIAPEIWADLGFTVDGRSRSRVGGVELILDADDDGSAPTRWALGGISAPDGHIDGLLTTVADPATSSQAADDEHPNGALAIDNVVVATPDVERTLDAFRAAGLEARAIRDGTGGRPLRQAFLLTRQALVEVVGPPAPAASERDGPAHFWGLTVTVADLAAAAAGLGARLGPIRQAVQPGRRIATISREAAGGLNLALMDPRPQRDSRR